jgi:iron uptake system component EfeO
VRLRLLLVPAVVLSVAVAVAACSDDGAGTRDSASESASDSGSGSGSASGSGSGSGSAISVDPSARSADPLVNEGAGTYTQYVRQQVDELVTATMTFTDAVRAGNVQAAKDAYAASRQAWERIEPVAGLVEDIDSSVDARVDDFGDENDPAWTGWHKLEYLLWVKNDISQASGAPALADRLDADIAKLKSTMATANVPASAIPSGAADLIEEVSEGKLTGEEDRYSGTDLWDFAANVAGSKQAFEALKAAIQAKNPELVSKIEAGFADIQGQLQAYAEGRGYRPYRALTDADKATMKTTLASLSENLAEVAGALGLQ